MFTKLHQIRILVCQLSSRWPIKMSIIFLHILAFYLCLYNVFDICETVPCNQTSHRRKQRRCSAILLRQPVKNRRGIFSKYMYINFVVPMGKRDGQILAFLHFTITEMRPLVLLWYTVYSTFANIVTSSAVSDAFTNQNVVACIYDRRINSQDVNECAKSAYRRYLPYGPQDPFKDCSDRCPGSGVGISAPEPRIMFFFMTAWLLGMNPFLIIFNWFYSAIFTELEALNRIKQIVKN